MTDVTEPSLLPTTEQWFWVFNFLTKNSLLPQAASFDASSMMKDFFRKPAELRLILCCWALYDQQNESTALDYFSRAKRALDRSSLIASLDLLITYNLFCEFAIKFGNPYITERFVLKATEVIIQLNLDVDPDDSLNLNFLSDREKEAFRRAFWVCYKSFMSLLHVSPSHTNVPLSFHRMKLPSQVYIHGIPIFSEFEKTLKPQLDLWKLIGHIKQSWSAPPYNFYLPAICHHLSNQMTKMHSTIDPAFLLTFDDVEIISPEEHTRFISQTLAAQENLCLLTMTQLASISVLYRPIVFLTGLPSHRPQNLTPESRNIILHAIKQVSEATIKSGVLFKFAFGMTHGENRNLVPKTDVFYAVYPAFESFVCAWFFACRMHPDWLPLVPAGHRNTPALRARLRFLLDSYSDRPVYQTTVPLRKTMYAMLEEMEQVARTGKRRSFNSNLEVGWEKELVELAKEYPFLNGNREGEDLKEPCCYLGLLGLDVGGKLLWKGRSEESWTLFWKMMA